VTALVRYLAADALRSQRWTAPLLGFAVAVAIIAPSDSAPLLPTMTMSAAALLPAALWLTVVVNHSEDPVQTHITGVTVGGLTRTRLAKLGTAYLGCLILTGLALVWVLTSTDDRITLGLLAIGVLEHLTLALAGVALGALVSRPVIPRIGWTVLAGVGICLAELLIPRVPPIHPLLTTFSDHPPANPWPTVALTAALTVPLAVAAILTAHLVARART
jgi:hypothetical protein